MRTPSILRKSARRSICSLKSGPQSTRIVASSSVRIHADVRKRLSRTSADRQTGQVHPISGTPVEVPLPNIVTCITKIRITELCASVSPAFQSMLTLTLIKMHDFTPAQYKQVFDRLFCFHPISHKKNFWLNGNPEFLIYRILHSFSQSNNVCPCSTTKIDQHQCLLVINSSRT